MFYAEILKAFKRIRHWSPKRHERALVADLELARFCKLLAMAALKLLEVATRPAVVRSRWLFAQFMSRRPALPCTFRLSARVFLQLCCVSLRFGAGESMKEREPVWRYVQLHICIYIYIYISRPHAWARVAR